jgi:hypothetical protein
MLQASLEGVDPYQSVLARLPADLDVETLARETKALTRRRGLQSGTALLRLAIAWSCGGQSMQEVAAWATEQGVAELTEEALLQRLHGAGAFLQAVSESLLPGIGARPSWQGRVFRIADSTSLSERASKGTDWRVHAVYDLGRGGFSHLEVTDQHGAEALDRGKPVAGEVRVGDRGFANAPAWQRYLQACPEDVDFIVRMRWNTIRLCDASGTCFDLIGWLRSRSAAAEIDEVIAWAQAGRGHKPTEIRLIARRKSPEDIEKAHKALRQRASRKQTNLDPRSLIAAEYLVLATSLSAEAFPAAEVLSAYRLRWQIELAFKRLKSLMQIDKIPTRTEAGTRCWLYGHLIVALLCEDFSQDLLDSFPSGPC